MEIERKFLVKELPAGLARAAYHQIEQAYLCTDPVVRIRRQDDDYILTWKGRGLLAREEYNLPLTEEGYYHMRKKADGIVLTKRRYLIPLGAGLTAELDLFEGTYEGLKLVEVEFSSEEEAKQFRPPAWFGEEVTYDRKYHNSSLSRADADLL